jgi:anti-anti-sigma factor
MKDDNFARVTPERLVGGEVQMAATRSPKALILTLEAPRFNGTVVLHCQGRVISRSDARALSGLISEVLPTSKRMVVNLAGIVSLDSDTLGELVLTHLWAEAAGYNLKFASPSNSVRTLFETTNLVSVFDIYPNVPEAMSAMHQQEVLSA